MSEHPNITARRNRYKLVRVFGERGTIVLRKGVMRVADTCTKIAERLNKWLESNRYGAEWR